MKSYTNGQIRAYLLDLKKDREEIDIYNKTHPIKKKKGNISEDATESLAYNFIADGIILKKEFGDIFDIRRKGKNGKDIVVNFKHVVEVKGTSSKDGFITVSKSNLKAFAWVWFDFFDFFNGNDKIVVNVIFKPECLNPYKIPSNGESKFSLKKAKECAKNNNCYFSVDVNFKTFNIIPIRGDQFFS